MESPQRLLVSKIAEIARKELELRTSILEAETLYNGSPDWDSKMTQTDINAEPILQAAGLTPQMIADVIYSANNANAAIQGNLPAFFVLANINI